MKIRNVLRLDLLNIGWETPIRQVMQTNTFVSTLFIESIIILLSESSLMNYTRHPENVEEVVDKIYAFSYV